MSVHLTLLKCQKILEEVLLERSGMCDGNIESRLKMKEKIVTLTKVLLKRLRLKLKMNLMSQSLNLYRQLANHKLFNKKIQFGLKRMKLALRLLGNPEKN